MDKPKTKKWVSSRLVKKKEELGIPDKPKENKVSSKKSSKQVKKVSRTHLEKKVTKGGKQYQKGTRPGQSTPSDIKLKSPCLYTPYFPELKWIKIIDLKENKRVFFYALYANTVFTI